VAAETPAALHPLPSQAPGVVAVLSGLQRLVRANCYVALGLTCCDGVLSVFAQVIEVEAARGGHKKYAAELGGRLPNAYGLS
jgi:hypothetical protein